MQRNFLRSGKILGTFKLDVATVMSQQGTTIEFNTETINVLFISRNISVQNFFAYLYLVKAVTHNREFNVAHH